MAGGCDEVEKSVNSVVSETRVTLDSRFFCQDVVVLSLEVANDFAKGRFVVDLVTEPRRVDDSKRYSCSLFVKFKFYTLLDNDPQLLMVDAHTDSDGLDPDSFLQVCVRSIVGLFLTKYSLSA